VKVKRAWNFHVQGMNDARASFGYINDAAYDPICLANTAAQQAKP
jgi:hypothetical protein